MSHIHFHFLLFGSQWAGTVVYFCFGRTLTPPPTHSPPEALLAALKEEDFGLSEFVWLDKKDKSESDNSHERNQKSSEGDEARARRIAEIRRRVEEEVARRRKEMAQQEEEAEKRAKRKNLADNALVLQCAHCSAPITKGMFTHIPVIAHSTYTW